MKAFVIGIIVSTILANGVVFKLPSKYNTKLQDYKDKNGGVEYSLSTFGEFYYSEVESLSVFATNEDNEFGCSRMNHPKSETKKFIWIVERGQCNYKAKAIQAEESGAAAVLVFHDEFLADVNNIIPSGDHLKNKVNIPVVLIQREVGDIIIEALRNNEKVSVDFDFSIVF